MAIVKTYIGHTQTWPELGTPGTPGAGVATGGTPGQVLAKASAANFDTVWVSAVPQAINAQTGTAYTLVLTDAGKILTFANSAAITVTVPPNSAVAFPIGTSIDLYQLLAGQFTVSGGAAPPTISKAMPTAKSRAQYSKLTLTKMATDVWILDGDAALS